MDMSEFQKKSDLCLRYYGDVMNGGHWSYFDQNSEDGFEDYQSILEILRFIGAEKQAETLTSVL